MDYLAACRAFVRAVDLGSFSKAAAAENQKVSTVSRAIGALEADLKAALLNRSTRGLHLTEAGAVFYERAVAILASVADAREATIALNATPQGLLRINVPASFGRHHVVPHLRDFRRSYSEIRLDVTLTDETVDLIETGTDVAIRIGALADSALVARRLAPQRRLLVCSPGYLAERPPPARPADLAAHECLSFALQASESWYFLKPGGGDTTLLEVKTGGSFRANDSDALLAATLVDMGIALLPSWLIAEEIASGRLVNLLPSWEGRIAKGPARAIWCVYPPKKTVSPKVRAFIGFFAKRFGQPPYWDRRIGDALQAAAGSCAGYCGAVGAVGARAGDSNS